MTPRRFVGTSGSMALLGTWLSMAETFCVDRHLPVDC